MPARRIEAGPLLALVGAVVLLIALFLDWYRPGLTAWEVFEMVDLVIAALSIGTVLTGLSHLGALDGPDPRALPWLCGAAFVLVVATLLNPPPVASAADKDTGLWLALAATLVMVVGAVLTSSRVKISFDVEGRRRRVSPVDSRRPSRTEAADAPAEGGALTPRRQRRTGDTEDGMTEPAVDDTDERPAYRMPFDPPDTDDDDEPVRPDEPWADGPRREPGA